MGGRGGEGEEHGEEGILQEDGLPEFAPLLLVEEGGVWYYDVGVAVEAYGVGLADEDSGEGPAVRGVVVVDEEVGDENHCLDGADRGFVEIGAHP